MNLDTQRNITAGLTAALVAMAAAALLHLASGCTDTVVVCAVDDDAGVALDAGEPCPHVNVPGDPANRASVHDMCASSCLLELICTEPEVPTESCQMRCFYPYDGKTEQHYYAMRECLHSLLPLTCEGWRACMAIP